MPLSPAVEVVAELQTWLIFDSMEHRAKSGYSGAIVMAWARKDLPGTVQLGYIEVAPCDRKKGHGTRILKKLMALCDERQVQLLAEVIKTKWTQAWYRRHGFVSQGVMAETGLLHLRAPQPVARPRKARRSGKRLAGVA